MFPRVTGIVTILGLSLLGGPAQAQPGPTAPIALNVDASQKGPTISRHLFGQFAEHLGRGVYEGVWVGPDSLIPNTRGMRNDVVAALKALKVPNVRWPGGCFADEYHWRNGIGPTAERRSTLNPNWGGVIEPDGTKEKRMQPAWRRSAMTGAVHVSPGAGPSRAKKMLFEASSISLACSLPTKVHSSTVRVPPGPAPAAPAEATSVGAHAAVT